MSRSKAMLDMQCIQAALAATPPINQQILSDMSKGPLKQYIQAIPESSTATEHEELWQCLMLSSRGQNTTEQYVTATCNCVSVFLLASTLCSCDAVRLAAFSQKTWFDAYDAAENAFDHGKTKPALQVLECLSQLLKRNPDSEATTAILRRSCRRLVKTLLAVNTHRQVKTACIALTCFIKKTDLLLYLEDIIEESLIEVSPSRRRFQLQPKTTGRKTPSAASGAIDLLMALLCAIENLETRSASLKLFSLLLHTDKWIKNHDTSNLAATAIEAFLEDRSDTLQDFAANALPVILDDKTRFLAFCDLYKPTATSSESSLILYLSVLRTGRMAEYISQNDLPRVLNQAMRDVSHSRFQPTDPYYAFRYFLRSGSSSLRVHAYKLLITAYGTISVVLQGVLDCATSCLSYLHDDNDAHERGEVISVHRRLLHRIQDSRSNLQKKQANQPSESDADILERYQTFLSDLGIFLLEDLRPGISYQRHILALGTLQLLVAIAGVDAIDLRSTMAALASLFLDPFDDVRSIASLILDQIHQPGQDSYTDAILLDLTRKTATVSARTCRHDHADASGRLWSIIESKKGGINYHNRKPFANLTNQLDLHLGGLSTMDLDSDFPLHSALLGLSYGLHRQPKDEVVNMQLLKICRALWTLVQPQLCIDSPETGIEDDEDGSLRGPKDLLAYAWRALRDSSVLLQAVLQSCGDNFVVISSIGRLCLEQLTLLRHRGAFSTVAQTFNLCCEKSRASSSSSTRQLNVQWYQAAFQQIDEQATKLTRRSAGLPAMLCAVLSASDPTFFAHVYNDLTAKASQSLDEADKTAQTIGLPQVHALNCLKDVFLSSKFRVVTEQYVGEMLQLAAESLSSPAWAIRNCGLMLLRASTNRLDKENLPKSPEVKGLIISKQYPLEIAKNLLRSGNEATEDLSLRSEILFAGLDLAKYLGTNSLDDEDLNVLIHRQLSNPVWAIRDQAARVLASRLLHHSQSIETLTYYLPLPHSSNNLVHGTLLLLRYLIPALTRSTSTPDLLDYLLSLIKAGDLYLGPQYSPYVKSAALDIMNDALATSLTQTVFPSSSIDARKHLRGTADEPTPSSNPYWRSRYLLFQSLDTLLDDGYAPESRELVREGFIQELVEDSEAVRSVVESPGSINITFSGAYMQILSEIISNTEASDVLAISMMTMARHLEAHYTCLSKKQAASLCAKCARLRTHDRDLFNASLRLEVCLLQLSLSDADGEMSRDLVASYRSWLDAARLAADDQLDFSTRMNAATALRQCGQQIALSLGKTGTGEATALMIDLLVLVYDQLNDDDDEIRVVAQYTASSILDRSLEEKNLSMRSCPVASRESILVHLTDNFSSTPKLASLAIQRVLGESQPDLSSPNPTIQSSVDERMEQIRASLDHLFAEEKQNLYIDELHEVDQWAGTLGKCDIKNVEGTVLTATTEWCSSGLDALMSSIMEATDDGGNKGNDFHPLHPTYNSELLLVFMQTVKLSHVLIQWLNTNNDDESDTYGRAGNLRQKLCELHSVCIRSQTHPRALQALTMSLADEEDISLVT